MRDNDIYIDLYIHAAIIMTITIDVLDKRFLNYRGHAGFIQSLCMLLCPTSLESYTLSLCAVCVCVCVWRWRDIALHEGLVQQS